MKKYFKGSCGAYDLEYALFQFGEAGYQSVRSVNDEAVESLLKSLVSEAQKSAQYDKASIERTLSSTPYLKTLYEQVSKDAARRAIYHDANVVWHFRDTNNQRDIVRKLVDTTLANCAVSQMRMGADFYTTEAIHDARLAVRYKISDMVWQWARLIHRNAYWAEVRKIVAEVMEGK